MSAPAGHRSASASVSASASSSRQSLPLPRSRTPSLERVASVNLNGPRITRHSSASSTHPAEPPSPAVTQRIPSPLPVRPTSSFSLLSNPPTAPAPPRAGTSNGPLITRVQSVMGEPPILGLARPTSPPRAPVGLTRHDSTSSSHYPHRLDASDSEQEELARGGGPERGGRQPFPFRTSSASLGRTHHSRGQTSESTTGSSVATKWNGGFTPKASQDPLILHQERQAPSASSASEPPRIASSLTLDRHVLPNEASDPRPAPGQPSPLAAFPANSPPALSSGLAPARPSQSQSIQISRPFTKIPSEPILSRRSNKPLRRYSLHQGSNRFLLSGLVLTSKDNPLPFLASLCVAAGLPALWLAFVGKGLWDNSQGEAGLGKGGKGAVIVFAYLALVMWSSMLKASLSDPGILPRDLDPSPQRKYIESDSIDQTTGEKGPGQFVAEIKYLRVRDGVVGSKWCETCEIYRPPRTSHCRLCDNCVELTDHHCAFLNNCIGRRNYFPFLAFLVSANLLLAYSIAFTAYYISLTPSSPRRWDSIGSYILLALLLAVTIPVAGLGLYHARLVWKNRTTIEMLRPKSSRGGLNPSTGEAMSNLFQLSSPAKNCVSVCCRPGLDYGGRGGWRDIAGRDARVGAAAAEGRVGGKEHV
ncbi:hypothetical protein JCM11491_001285 [Sporobolomyces phaffii]